MNAIEFIPQLRAAQKRYFMINGGIVRANCIYIGRAQNTALNELAQIATNFDPFAGMTRREFEGLTVFCVDADSHFEAGRAELA